jgi:hypothetical protein
VSLAGALFLPVLKEGAVRHPVRRFMSRQLKPEHPVLNGPLDHLHAYTTLQPDNLSVFKQRVQPRRIAGLLVSDGPVQGFGACRCQEPVPGDITVVNLSGARCLPESGQENSKDKQTGCKIYLLHPAIIIIEMHRYREIVGPGAIAEIPNRE